AWGGGRALPAEGHPAGGPGSEDGRRWRPTVHPHSGPRHGRRPTGIRLHRVRLSSWSVAARAVRPRGDRTRDRAVAPFRRVAEAEMPPPAAGPLLDEIGRALFRRFAAAQLELDDPPAAWPGKPRGV